MTVRQHLNTTQPHSTPGILDLQKETRLDSTVFLQPFKGCT